MKHATAIVLVFIALIVTLTAFLRQPAVLLALAFIPSFLNDLPFGLLAKQEPSGDDYVDPPQPMGFTQNVQSR